MNSEADIIEEVLSGTLGDLDKDAVRLLLRFRFGPKSIKRIRRLLQKNNKGAISAEERLALEKYLRVGQFFDILQAKAHLLIRERSS